jgi:single-strand DNA-binding protein
MGVNKTLIIGRLGADATYEWVAHGQGLLKFSIAVDCSYKNRAGEKIEDVQWFSVTCWGAHWENLTPYLTKGKQIYVEGEMRSKNFTGKDGVERTSWALKAQQIAFVGGSNGGAARED